LTNVSGIAGKSKAVLSTGTLNAAMGCELFADDLRPDRTSRGRLESVLLADLNNLPQPVWSLQRGFLVNGGDNREGRRIFGQDSHELDLGDPRKRSLGGGDPAVQRRIAV
jgi:hypothetical protein